MIKRLYLYLKEMLPPLKCLLASSVLFFEIYFMVVLIAGVPSFRLGMQEATGCFTVFAFLLSLRIADDFKDYKTDLELFPDRPLPSGRVKKSDLAALLVLANAAAIALNIAFMNNLPYYAALLAYGTLMSVWFFARSKIQKNLFLALLTHNPVDVAINVYIVSFACIKYGLELFTFTNLLIVLTLYWPCLIWEISRKIRAPEDETAYTTYSKLYGYKKITLIVLGIITIDLVTSAKLMAELWVWGNVAVVAAWLWFVWQIAAFLKNPKRFKLVSRIEIYEVITEIPVILVQVGVIWARGVSFA